jgi:hypothetical protein
MTDSQTVNISETLRLHTLWLAGDPAGVRANLSYANLHGANLHGANLHGANLNGANLRGANLRGAILNGAILSRANLSYANLRGANLRGANLRGAILNGANLRGANLSYAILRGANLSGANLSHAILNGANLRGANLSYAILRGAILHGAILNGAILNGANGLPIAADAQQRLRAVASHVLDHPQILQMKSWHSECGTTHCLAGWAIHQAGTLGEVLEKLHGPYMAGLLLLGANAAAHFYDSNDDAIAWLQSVAQEAA